MPIDTPYRVCFLSLRSKELAVAADVDAVSDAVREEDTKRKGGERDVVEEGDTEAETCAKGDNENTGDIGCET